MVKFRHKLIYAILSPVLKIFFRLVYGYRGLAEGVLKKNEPALILSNHNGALDPFFLALSFKSPVYFLASDHIFRLGFISKVIEYLVRPIPIVKSQLDLKAIKQMNTVIKEGGLVGIFPEGNRSFNGKTCFIGPAIGKLVKNINASLVIYRMDGGYLTRPRWAKHKRRGHFEGRVVEYVSKDQLKNMTGREIHELIKERLDLDAFLYQRHKCSPYRGKKLAERLEITLFICPNCQSMATVFSKIDKVFCSVCQLELKYNEFGFFEPIDSLSIEKKNRGDFLDTVLSWDLWQRKTLPEILKVGALERTEDKRYIFKDTNQTLVLTEKASRSHILSRGDFYLYQDRMVFLRDGNLKSSPTEKSGSKLFKFKETKKYQHLINTKEHEFRIEHINRVIVHGPKTLQFTDRDNKVYEIRSKHWRSAYKYLLAFDVLKANLQGGFNGFYSI